MDNASTSSPVSVAIIGSGPAGYTAAIYAARAGLDVVLYQGLQPGGQLTTTTEVENFPGYPEGALGSQMMVDFQTQAQRFGTDIRNATVTAVNFSCYPFQLTIDTTTTVEAKTVIIATGASAKWLGLESEKRLNGRGVSACATCDGFFFRGQDVAVVGGGDTAAEEALHLSKICNKVYVLVRSDKMRASHIMQQRLISKPNVSIFFNTGIEEILGDQEVEGVRLFDKRSQTSFELLLQGFFVAIGHQPNTALFAPYITLDNKGYIQTTPGSTKTNIPGVFAAGDVQDSIYRQAITAAGTGCMAALDAERFLATEGQ
ncbi:thioredoxin reductase [Candidatus Amoebophilus asiaticus 5a2]|uniref:Thioredoxin reductase n=1 Tax=Amoebophilus asiaticus (strain 5a2) TaxID=452471 RepID=B3EU53_AMOA5|nr:thioredoxin-disulfide reductase [Candidatus Amoebophilus asiaticus]ACE05472.1 thioredoxin reductase [Candidatus Amoebophilus asiaticus 5a2]